jgi:hypothetical protein
MNHCLNCGAIRESNQCPTCGLTTLAAELLLRRRLLMLTAVLLVGAVTFLPVSQMYPPLELDAIFIFVGLLVFAALALGVIVDRRARRQQEVEVLRRIFLGLVPVPWLLAALLFANGRFDPSPAAPQVVSVVGKFTMPGMLRSTRLAVTSWRAGRRIERIPLAREDFHRFRRGDVVEIQMQEGLVGIPWVSGVHRK